ncbi:hypothetical protein P692DRAFT_20725420, partial [Suillus brevipes Sb2]
PTLQTVENLVGLWRKEWGSECMWNATFDGLLECARVKGKDATTIFFEECGRHIAEGRCLLESVHEVVHTLCVCCRERLKGDTVLLYDLLICIMSQVTFFEVKLDIMLSLD